MEAPRIRIPERYQPGIAKLIALPDNTLEELSTLLNEQPKSLNLASIKDYISKNISGISETDIDEIISALDALYYLKNESGSSAIAFSDQILQAMAETENQELKLKSSLQEVFRERLIKLINGKLLRVAVRSRNVLYEQERTFGSAGISSDIRVVFEEVLEDTPETAIIVHTLKIHYIQDNQHKEFFVALDTADISMLIDTLIHAQEKEEALKSILAAANVPYIDAE